MLYWYAEDHMRSEIQTFKSSSKAQSNMKKVMMKAIQPVHLVFTQMQVIKIILQLQLIQCL